MSVTASSFSIVSRTVSISVLFVDSSSTWITLVSWSGFERTLVYGSTLSKEFALLWDFLRESSCMESLCASDDCWGLISPFPPSTTREGGLGLDRGTGFGLLTTNNLGVSSVFPVCLVMLSLRLLLLSVSVGAQGAMFLIPFALSWRLLPSLASFLFTELTTCSIFGAIGLWPPSWSCMFTVLLSPWILSSFWCLSRDWKQLAHFPFLHRFSTKLSQADIIHSLLHSVKNSRGKFSQFFFSCRYDFKYQRRHKYIPNTHYGIWQRRNTKDVCIQRDRSLGSTGGVYTLPVKKNRQQRIQGL